MSFYFSQEVSVAVSSWWDTAIMTQGMMDNCIQSVTGLGPMSFMSNKAYYAASNCFIKVCLKADIVQRFREAWVSVAKALSRKEWPGDIKGSACCIAQPLGLVGEAGPIYNEETHK